MSLMMMFVVFWTSAVTVLGDGSPLREDRAEVKSLYVDVKPKQLKVDENHQKLHPVSMINRTQTVYARFLNNYIVILQYVLDRKDEKVDPALTQMLKVGMVRHLEILIARARRSLYFKHYSREAGLKNNDVNSVQQALNYMKNIIAGNMQTISYKTWRHKVYLPLKSAGLFNEEEGEILKYLQIIVTDDLNYLMRQIENSDRAVDLKEIRNWLIS